MPGEHILPRSHPLWLAKSRQSEKSLLGAEGMRNFPRHQRHRLRKGDLQPRSWSA